MCRIDAWEITHDPIIFLRQLLPRIRGQRGNYCCSERGKGVCWSVGRALLVGWESVVGPLGGCGTWYMFLILANLSHRSSWRIGRFTQFHCVHCPPVIHQCQQHYQDGKPTSQQCHSCKMPHQAVNMTENEFTAWQSAGSQTDKLYLLCWVTQSIRHQVMGLDPVSSYSLSFALVTNLYIYLFIFPKEKEEK